MSNIIDQPIKFLGATVLSFNTTLGLGAGSESTLNVDLVEDCEAGDVFAPLNGTVEVGSPVYFSAAGTFSFGGILTNWTATQGGGGKTFNVKVSDPRQLLENTIVIVDSFVGPPDQLPNYFNVYAFYEKDILNGNCNVFGDSGSSERGMPYIKILQALQQMNLTICSPNPPNTNFTIDWSTFPANVPSYYRVSGPGISLLQLLQDVCDVLGLEFHVVLLPGSVIAIRTIDVSVPPPSFGTIIAAYDGIATELSYGEELRNEKTKSLIFGEKQHYLSYINNFEYFFGEDLDGAELKPVVPLFHDNKNGFWINKKIEKINATLFKPLNNNGPYLISELDIRSAMSSYDTWKKRATDKANAANGSLNKAIQINFPECEDEAKKAMDDHMGNPARDPVGKFKAMTDQINNPTRPGAKAGQTDLQHDLEALHGFVQDLGNTYYGKQWLCKLNQKICVRQGENFQEKIFSDVPTGEGGWVDGNVPILGLSEPELTFFRSDDYRINGFAVFNIDGEPHTPPSGDYPGTIGTSPTDSSYSPDGGDTPDGGGD